MKPINEWNVAVVGGAGTMGLGMALHFAINNHKVTMYDLTQEDLERAYEMIKSNIATLVELGEMKKQEVQAILDRISIHTNMSEALNDADFVIESVTENADVKKEIFAKMDQLSPKHAYLCSNTSSLNIYSFVETSRPEKILITHFFNPAHVMPLVEIVRGPETPDETVEIIKTFLSSTKKKPIVISECITGFIGNRLTGALVREAFHLVENGWVTVEDVDTVMTTTFGPRYVFEGIFGLYDHIGLDVGEMVGLEVMPQLCQSQEPSSVLREKVKAGELGVKTGRGLRDYSGQDIKEIKKNREIKIIKTLRHMETL